MKTPLSNGADGIAVGIATGCGVGFIALAPGTFGSALGVVLFFPLSLQGPSIYVAVLAALGAVGVWSSSRAEIVFERKDDGRIVIDEVVGQLLTLLPLLLFRGVERVPREFFFFLVVTGFVAFRVLDIAKPGWIRRVEQSTDGGFGVMADDLVAGVFGAGVLAVATYGVLSWRGVQ
ncbi:MAG: phosphatidylglycerophosphatase A [bacterium]|nr:phosphatidylglycerophosphatase A [bacterium]